jgi:hypothetical protein
MKFLVIYNFWKYLFKYKYILNTNIGSGEAWWLNREAWWLNREAWWLSGSAPECCPAVLGSNPQRLCSPQLTANLLMGCHLGWHLAAGWPLWGSIEEKIMKNEPLVRQKHIKKTNIYWKCIRQCSWCCDVIYVKHVTWNVGCLREGLGSKGWTIDH